jgi:hypothetical protein
MPTMNRKSKSTIVRLSVVFGLYFCTPRCVESQYAWGQKQTEQKKVGVSPRPITTSVFGSGNSLRSTEPVTGRGLSSSDLFRTDLKIISERFGVAIVAENEPQPITKNSPIPTLEEKLSAEEAIHEVADYFDYSAVRKGAVYLFTKRYTHPEDLPDVTLEECKRSLKTISKMLAAFNPKIPAGTFAGDPQANIAHLLDADQLIKLGKEGLPVSELTANQHDELWRLARKFYLQAQADQIQESSNYLENRNPADPVFHWQTINNVYAFGYDTRSERLNRILFIPVSHSNRIMVSPNGITVSITEVTNDGHESPADPDAPSELPEETKKFLDAIGSASSTVSLSIAVSKLNGTTAKPLYKVDAAYAAKHVTLVGIDKLPAELLLKSLAAVYGLRLLRYEDGRILLTGPEAVEATQISDLRPSLISAIPLPIYQALNSRFLVPNDGAGKPSAPISATDYLHRSVATRNSALRMFRYMAQPKVKSQPKQKLALSHLTSSERNMFALASTIDLYALICQLAESRVPPYISNLDQLILLGGLYQNETGAQRFSFWFAYRNTQTGDLRRTAGFTNAIVP